MITLRVRKLIYWCLGLLIKARRRKSTPGRKTVFQSKFHSFKEAEGTDNQNYSEIASCSSFAILEAMFLKAIDDPEMRLKRTPLSDKRGSLHTSISQ